ncbi:hypothetical protein I4U23_011515 [Adineta vaga]|nr:hypothetical protein I4U23_011515 [Adineta vaga]
MLKCAIIGSGPTAIYTLKHLLDSVEKYFDLTVFEKATVPGKGTPYGSEGCSLHDLSNSSSLEIPSICQSLEAWLISRSDVQLQNFNIKRDKISDQSFYPRFILGDYFADQLSQLVARGNKTGHNIQVKASTQVYDLEVLPEGIRISYIQDNKEQHSFFSKVAIATGHAWPQETSRTLNYYLSPWPISKLDGIKPGTIGILGSSLTAIEIAINLALKHGRFERIAKGVVQYQVAEHSKDLHLTLFSRKGILPEADFYVSDPYIPLDVFKESKIYALCAKAETEANFPLLENLFTLFKAEIILNDPDYARSMNLEQLTIEEFHAQYFKERIQGNVFTHAKEDLTKARQTYQTQQTIPWRFAILRMNDLFDSACPYFSAEELQCFNQSLRLILMDNYSCVPHKSMEKIIALHEVGILDVLAVGDDYTLSPHSDNGGAFLKLENGEVREFQTFIDATGQPTLGATNFPFKTLLSQGKIKDALVAYASQDISDRDIRQIQPEEVLKTVKIMGRYFYKIEGIAVDKLLHPIGEDGIEVRLNCAALPFLLELKPLIQAITTANKLGETIAMDFISYYSANTVKLDQER